MTNIPFKTVKSPLTPKAFGKPNRRMANMSAKAHLQVFKPKQTVDRLFATLATNGSISFFILKLVNLVDSYTSNTSAAMRPLFVSVALDPKQYETRQGRVSFNDSNPQMVSTMFQPKSPFNSALIKGSFTTNLIPCFINNKENPELNWDNVEHNKHTKRLVAVINKIEAATLTEADKKNAYQKAWAEYQAKEKELLDKGIIVPNNILVANQNGIVPSLTVNQYTNSSNKFLDAETLFSNENSTATYAPIINTVDAVVKFTDNSIDEHSNWVYGINTLNSGSEGRELKATSAEVNVYDFMNQLTTRPMRVVVQDTYVNVNAKEGDTRSERFLEFTENNSQAMITDAQLFMGYTSLGGLTSTFSLQGESIYYKEHEMPNTNQSEINVDLDGEQDIETDNLLEVDDILASLGEEDLLDMELEDDVLATSDDTLTDDFMDDGFGEEAF